MKRGRRIRPRPFLARLLVLAACVGALAWGAYTLFPFPYRAQVTVAARQSALDPRLLLAVARAESRFRPDVVSRRGAVGLMQLTPSTAAWIASQRRPETPYSPSDLRDPAYNLSAGAWYLARLLQDYADRLPVALAAYNAGPTPVNAWLASGAWAGTRADVARIPYPETREFVRRVLTNYAVYRALYPKAAHST